MRQFKTATFVLTIVELIGWACAGLAVAAIAASIKGNQPPMILAGAAALAAFGLTVIAIAQIGHAQIHTAQNSDRILEALRDLKHQDTAKRY